MDKFMGISQIVMAAIMLACVIVLGIANAVRGAMSLSGLLILGFIAFVIWQICRSLWFEYQEEKDK